MRLRPPPGYRYAKPGLYGTGLATLAVLVPCCLAGLALWIMALAGFASLFGFL